MINTLPAIKRTTANIKMNIDILNDLGVDFEVQHGTYTTSIKTSEGINRYMMNEYSNRVFICANMIKQDILKSEKGKEVMNMKFLKSNYFINRKISSLNFNKVLNIDLNSAYAICLYNNKLISQKTFDRIKSLPKEERLPVVGMLATSFSKFYYSGGDCNELDMFRSPTSGAFFFLIDEINYLMQDIQFLLGDNFIFYWVDGVFFNQQTPVEIIDQIEDLITQRGYEYKYEQVENFSVSQIDTKVTISMLKNNEAKTYITNIDKVGKELNKQIVNTIAHQDKAPKIKNKLKK